MKNLLILALTLVAIEQNAHAQRGDSNNGDLKNRGDMLSTMPNVVSKSAEELLREEKAVARIRKLAARTTVTFALEVTGNWVATLNFGSEKYSETVIKLPTSKNTNEMNEQGHHMAVIQKMGNVINLNLNDILVDVASKVSSEDFKSIKYVDFSR